MKLVMCLMSTRTEVNVPLLIDWRVMIPNHVSILGDQGGATGVKGMEGDVRVLLQPGLNVRGGMCGQVVQDDVDLLAAVWPDGLLDEAEKSRRQYGSKDWHSPNTSPVPTLSAANRFVVPWRM